MRLLLVEDDRALGQGIRVALGAEGYTLDWLQDGVSALHALRTESFDLLLLDLQLPLVGEDLPWGAGVGCPRLDAIRAWGQHVQ